MTTSPFVSTDWLAERLDDPNIRIIDGSWHMPNQNRDAQAEFLAGHIPGAVHFEIDRIADQSSTLPHMVAPAEKFADEAGKLGLSEQNTLVVYDCVGLFTAARVWWNFKIMGVPDVRVLSGGLPKWQAEDRPMASGPATPKPATFVTRPLAAKVKNSGDVRAALEEKDIQVVDVRAATRFAGDVPEPRAGLRAGHMPGAMNLPFSELIADGQMRPPAELAEILARHGVDPSKPVITSCGSGVTATLLNLALNSLGHEQLQAYDGSWAEWGADTALPVVTR